MGRKRKNAVAQDDSTTNSEWVSEVSDEPLSAASMEAQAEESTEPEQQEQDDRGAEIAKLKAELDALKLKHNPPPPESRKWKSVFRHGNLDPSVKHLRVFECVARTEDEVKAAHIKHVEDHLLDARGNMVRAPQYLDGFRQSVASGPVRFDIQPLGE